MGYITQEDLLRADGNLVWNMAINRETNELDEDKIRQAISDAEAEIDSFLSRRYQLPLGVTEIRARCNAWRYRWRFTGCQSVTIKSRS